jgi:hypothetical protein
MSNPFSAGTLPVWRHPIRKRRSLSEVDSLIGDYKCARSTTLAPGDFVPGFPGMQITGLEETETALSHEYSIVAEGSLNGLYETKTLSRSESRSIGANFETFTERKLSWHTGRKAITGVASTDVITSTAHGFANTQKVVLVDVSGGAGLTSQSQTAIGVVYYVRDAATDTFKLAATSGGSAIDFTTDIASGYVIAAEFCPGTVHPDFPAMYLVSVGLSDSNTGWRIADCQYAGLLWSKPYDSIVTCDGQQFSSSEPITITGITGGWSSPLYTNFHLPEIVLTERVVTASAPSTVTIPSMSIPTNAPSIQSLTLSGSDDLFIWNYPYGWSLMASSEVERLNSKINMRIAQNTYRYIWPKLFK